MGVLMSEEIIKLKNPYDEDGYTTLQCPFCKLKFKIKNNEYIEEEITFLYCPYCGLTTEKSHFIDADIREQAMILGKNIAIDMVNKMFKGIEQKLKGNKYIRFKRGKPIKKEGEKILFDKFKNAKIIETNCCAKHIKVNGTMITKIYCPYCGEING
jgi:hypothetical protein